MKTSRSGFTVGELVVVILVIGFLLLTLIPIMLNSLKLSRDLSSQNNLKQIGLAIQNMEAAHGQAPPMFGPYADADLGSIWYHMLPFIEQEWLHNSGPRVSKQTSFKSLVSSLDPTLTGSRFGVPFELNPQSASLSGGNPVPDWAAAETTGWGLTSYGANWMVFGDQARPMQATIRDGFAQSVIVTEKYALTRQQDGEPKSGANLWAYGWSPPGATHQWAREPSQLKDPSRVLKSLYNEPYWPRIGYTNQPGAVPSSWAKDQPWEFRNHLKPQFAPDPLASDPFREQGFLSASINVLNADGSATRLGSGISDEVYFRRICPDDGAGLTTPD